MTKFRLPAILLVFWAAVSCGWIGGNDDAFRLIHVADVGAMLDSSDSPVTLLDANGPDFREREGVIPGAALLTSYSKFDVTKELPSDKGARLVFYCADSH